MSGRSLRVACAASFVAMSALLQGLASAEAQEADPSARPEEKVTSLPRDPAGGIDRQAAQTLDLRFIHRDCFAALIVHPGEALKSPSLRSMPTEMLEKLAFGRLPFEFSQMREIVLLYGIDASFEYMCGAICRFEQPYNLEKLLAGVEAVDAPPAAGRPTMYRVRGTKDQGVALPDDRTVLLAPVHKLSGMLRSKAGASPLAERLQRTDVNRAATFVGVTWPVQAAAPFMTELFDADDREVLRILTLCKAAEVRFDISEDVSITIVLDCDNAQDVSDLNRLLDRAVILCQQFFDGEPAEGEKGDEALLELSLMQYAKRMIGQLASAFDCQETDDRLILRIKAELCMTVGFGAFFSECIYALADTAGAPADSDSREESQKHLQQLADAMQVCHDVREKLPQNIVDANGKPLLSWRVDLLPFLGEQELYQQFHLDEPWDSEHNLKLAERMPAILRSDRHDCGSKTCFLAVVGPDALFSAGKQFSLAQLGEPSQTVLLVEANASRAVPWTKPADFVFNPADPLAGLGGRHAGGFLALQADGIPQFIYFGMTPDEFRARFRSKTAEAAEDREEK